MHSGLDRILRDFRKEFETPQPVRKSRSSSVSSQRSGVSALSSLSSLTRSLSNKSSTHPTTLELEPEEDAMRRSLENAVTAAIDLFQNVDKHQLSHLGATTDLTGPDVERMLERYVAEQIYDVVLFPCVRAVRRSEDLDLESRIRRMADIDISQVGIPIEGGLQGKRELATRLAKGVEIFKKLGVAGSPQEMVDILLATQKSITGSEPAASGDGKDGVEVLSDTASEKPSMVLTINADVLVSMLLIVVVRSSVRHLQARLSCMRHFIFIDDVESGEMGYALSTFEAVLAYLAKDAGGLRKASQRNRKLWQATRVGNLAEMKKMLETDRTISEEDSAPEPDALDDSSLDHDSPHGEYDNGMDGLPSEHVSDCFSPLRDLPQGDFAAVGGSLSHVFPFQRPPTPPPEGERTQSKKRVSMAPTRSTSFSSGYSSRSRSRTKSTDSVMSATVEGDCSVEKLLQTQNPDGESVMMIAVEAGQLEALQYLLSLREYYSVGYVLEDCNTDGMTLLSAAVQSGNRGITEALLEYLLDNSPDDNAIRSYLAMQDTKGRCVAHYLFNMPRLMTRIDEKLPWRQKDRNGQTPLFALSRSYDHEEYYWMTSTALRLATKTQGDGEPLHLDDHVDGKGNTLLHIVNDPALTLKLLHHCDSDVNAVNDRRFSPLMVASKYGRIDLVRALFGDPRVEMHIKDLRGLTAVELAKDDEVRNRIDDLVLMSSPPGPDGRSTTIVRSFFVEDATVRLIIKSGAPNAYGSITVTTCRRSIAEFENLAKWLAIEHPASWLPTQFNLPSPFLLPSKPSRAVLRDVQIRLDNFLHNLLSHATFGTHEMVWEFFLVPDIDWNMLAERSKRKAELRVENVKEDYLPIVDTADVELFVAHAKDQLR
ncbi:hypothetical protein LTR66_002954, partial [Elasticomyces elasticus]